ISGRSGGYRRWTWRLGGGVSGGVSQRLGDGAQAAVGDAGGLQGVGGLQHVVGAAAIASVPLAHDGDDPFDGKARHVARVLAIHGEDQAGNRAGFRMAVQPARNVGRAGHFPLPQGTQDIQCPGSGDAVGDAIAGTAQIQAEYQAGAFGCAAIDPRPQAQGAVVAVDAGPTGLQVTEFRPPDQGPVAEHPKVGAAVPVPQGLFDGRLVPGRIAQVEGFRRGRKLAGAGGGCVHWGWAAVEIGTVRIVEDLRIRGGANARLKWGIFFPPPTRCPTCRLQIPTMPMRMPRAGSAAWTACTAMAPGRRWPGCAPWWPASAAWAPGAPRPWPVRAWGR